MSRSIVFGARLFALVLIATSAAGAQSVTLYQTTPDLLEALSKRETLHFLPKANADAQIPKITVDDSTAFSGDRRIWRVVDRFRGLALRKETQPCAD